MKDELISKIIESKQQDKVDSIWTIELDGKRLVMNSNKSSWKTKGHSMNALINSIKEELYRNRKGILSDDEERNYSSFYSKIKPTILSLEKEKKIVFKEHK